MSPKVTTKLLKQKKSCHEVLTAKEMLNANCVREKWERQTLIEP